MAMSEIAKKTFSYLDDEEKKVLFDEIDNEIKDNAKKEKTAPVDQAAIDAEAKARQENA